MRNITGIQILLAIIILAFGSLCIWLMIFKLILPGIWNFLIVDEAPKPSDVIIVLSGDEGRFEYGLELYQADYAEYILFAGGAAQSMGRLAVAAGIDAAHILLDRKSNSTFENAQNSLEIMQANKLGTAIIVTSKYHTKRTSLIFSRFIPRSDLTICAVPDGSTPENWWKNRRTATLVVLEYFKLVWHFLFEN